MTSTTTPSGDFVEALFNDMAYQPDDALAVSALESRLGPDFTNVMNGAPLTRAEFIKLMMDARAGNSFTLEKSEEIVASMPKKDGDLHAVGHLQRFSARPKAQGHSDSTVSSLTLSLVKVLEDGSRQLVQMTEVSRRFSA